MSNNNQHISLQEAIELTTRYRANRPADFFISETFEASNLQELLNEPDCQCLRIYLGRKPDNSVVALLVGVNSRDQDILPSADTDAAAAGTGGVILEDGTRCPEFCPTHSPLNP